VTTQKKADNAGSFYYVTGTGAGTAADPFIETVGAASGSGGDATAANQTTQITDLGSVTETAPATDTASSGLNGRLQRVAQRLTSLIALIPALGAANAAGSLPVTLANDGVAATLLGGVTETAPATDTASSGLNGRLQRIAQRLTTIIAGITVSSITLPTTIYNNKKLVTTAGVRVALATTQAISSGVTIKALVGNTGVIYVGDSTVASTNGLALAPGDTIFLEIANLTTVNLDSSVSGEGVTYIAT
jgi:hypothetical protein